MNQAKLEEGMDTSSFNEDLSVTQKIEGGNDSVKKGRKAAPQLGLTQQLSATDELGKVSDPNLKELSIVESEHSNHVDTPADVLNSMRQGGFHDFVNKQIKDRSKYRSKVNLMYVHV